jgi:hypothetical protein
MKLLHALMAASFLVILSLFEVQGDGGPQKEAEVVNPVAVNVFWRRRSLSPLFRGKDKLSERRLSFEC